MEKVRELVARKYADKLEYEDGLLYDQSCFQGIEIDYSIGGVSVHEVIKDPEDFDRVILIIPVVGGQICLWPIVPELGDCGHVGKSIFPAEELLPRLETAIDLLI